MIEARVLTGPPDPHDEGDDRNHGRADDHEELLTHEVRDPENRARRERQLGAEALVEIREGRHHLQHDDRDEHQRERDQDRRVHQRRHGLALHVRDDLRVLDVPPKHAVQAAAAFAGQQRRRVDARKQIGVRGEGVRQRRPRPHALVHIVEHTAEDRRLDERHARLEQRGQLLVEHEELARRDAAALWQPQRQPRNRTLGLQR